MALNCNKWYTCPISLAVFSVFLFLLMYNIYSCYMIWDSITEYTKQLSTNPQAEGYLKKLERLYLLNIICTFISFAVVFRFITKAFNFDFLLHEFVLNMLAVFVIVLSSFNIFTYQKLPHAANYSTLQSINAVALGVSSLLIMVVIILYIMSYYGEENKSSV